MSNGVWPGGLGNFNINGGQTWQTATYEDGIISTTMDGGTTINSVSVGVEEIKVITGAMPAEYGHATSGALLVVKKAGTNSLHGEGGYLFKNQEMMERRFFHKTTIEQDNPNNRTLFRMPDFVVSGPVVLPKDLQRQEQDLLRGWRIVAHRHLGQLERRHDSHPRYVGRRFQRLLQHHVGSLQHHRLRVGRQPIAHAIREQPDSGQPLQKLWTNLTANPTWNTSLIQPGIGSVNPTGPSGNYLVSTTGAYFNKTEQVRLDHSFTDKFKVSATYHLGPPASARTTPPCSTSRSISTRRWAIPSRPKRPSTSPTPSRRPSSARPKSVNTGATRPAVRRKATITRSK